jgi:hypothetical protein
MLYLQRLFRLPLTWPRPLMWDSNWVYHRGRLGVDRLWQVRLGVDDGRPQRQIQFQARLVNV